MSLPTDNHINANQDTNEIHRNFETKGPFRFIDDQKTHTATFTDLASSKINRQIYYSPTGFPRINRFDISQGSCFQGWYVPSPSVEIHHDRGEILALHTTCPDIALDQYRDYIRSHLESYIKEIYLQHHTVNLLHSGGIDSTLILAQIVALGLAKQTRVICVINDVTQHPLTLRNQPARQQNIRKFFDAHRSDFLSCEFLTCGVDCLIDIINTGRNYYHLQNYVTSWLFDQFHDQAWIGGHHGNRTLFHHEVFLSQLVKVQGVHEVQKQLQICLAKNYLDQQLNLTAMISEPDLSQVTHCIKYFDQCNHWNNNILYMPVGTEDVFNKLRRLHVDDLSVQDIVSADFVMSIIKDLAPDLIPWIDTSSSQYDYCVIKDIVPIAVQNLDPQFLHVPCALNHDQQGLEWIQNMMSHDTIDLNTIMSIKNLQLIHENISTCSSATEQ